MDSAYKLPKALFSDPKLAIGWLVELCVALLIVNALVKAVYNVYFHPLKDFPGPWLARASPFPYIWRLCNGDMVKWQTKLHLRYGNVVRIQPDELTFSTPSAWSEIFMSRPQLPRPAIGTIVNVNGVRPVVHELKAEDHMRQRKVLNHAFTSKALNMQEYILQDYVDRLVKRFAELGTSGNETDICDWYEFISFDIIGDLVFGDSFGSLENAAYHPWVKTLLDALKAASMMSSFGYFPLFRLLGCYVPSFVTNILRKPLYIHFQFTVDHLNKRIARKTERPDVVKFVLEHNHEGGLTRDELDTQMQLLIFSGSSTVAATLGAVTWFTLKNPSVMQRLRQEIRDAFQTYEEIDVGSTSKLQYLHAVIKEALRLHPPAATSNPRYTDRPITVNGYYVPPGVRAGIPQQASNTLERNFKDPFVFAPERWLPEGQATYGSDKKDVCEPFSVGPRICLGKNLAMAEMDLILCKIFWKFDLELTPNNVPDWNDQKVFLTHQKLPLRVRIHHRQESKLR